ncbi:MAG: diguanylate cyclase [Cycloclasticus sp.]|nr:diguanylate cyclase [Cycloclasticus sp.]
MTKEKKPLSESEFSNGEQFAIRLLRNLIVPTFVLGADGKVLIWNKACVQLTGVSAEKLVGTRDHWQAFYDEPRDCLADLVLKDKLDEIKGLYDVRIDSKDDEQHFSVESWCEVPASPGNFYLSIDAGPIFNEKGKMIAVVETLRDLTEQRLAQDELEKMAQVDGLTELANRRTFDDRLKTDWGFAQRQQTPLALLFIDIDFFKPFNDIYGHQAGDDCLKKVARTISQEVKRPSDLVARYGGEEFTVILPGENIESAITIADRIRSAVYALNYEHEGNSETGRVTVSVGAASIVPVQQQASNELIEWADTALYDAKSGGRNKVASHTG